MVYAISLQIIRDNGSLPEKAGRNVRALPALLVAALLGTTVVACGGAARVASSSSSPSTGLGTNGATATTASSSAVPSGGFLKEDGDKDSDDGAYPAHPGQDDQSFLATYGVRAPPAEARTIAALVRRYYAASLAGDGASTCELLDAGIATALAAQQGTAAHGTAACAASLSPLLAQQHQHLLAEEPTMMVVTSVYAKDNVGVAVLGFRNAPESIIVLAREGHAWKIDALFDSPLT